MMRESQEIQVSLVDGIATATFENTSVKVTPEGNALVATDKGVRRKTVEDAAATQDKPAAILVQDHKTVILYGVKIEREADGGLALSAKGIVTMNAAAPPVTPAKRGLKVGSVMPDGTIYAGESQDTNKPMFAAPIDAPTPLNFMQAGRYARRLNVHGKGFRVPSEAELRILAENCEEGALKGTFNRAAGEASLYWSSRSISDTNGSVRQFSNGALTNRSKYYKWSVRCVR